MSLANFPEYDPSGAIGSPRSLMACKSEGVLPQDLIFKPQEAFQERALSPRLAKLRYDFFEAKRRDLLAATRRARDKLVGEEERDRSVGGSALDVISKQSGLSMGALMALNSEGLRLERQKLLRAQENERIWLRNALNNELNMIKKLESDDKKLTEESKADDSKAAETSKRLKSMNDKRMKEEEKKQRESEAKQRLEKELAKEEFHKQQVVLAKQKEVELAKQQEIYARQLAEMDRKRQAEVAKEEKKQLAYMKQQEKVQEMRAQDLKRMDIMEQQKQEQSRCLVEKKEERDMRIFQSVEKNQVAEFKRREEFEEKMQNEGQREERMALERAEKQEQTAKQSFQLMLRRRTIQDQAARKIEERRQGILEASEETEMRLMEHEQKKERYLDFKRELDSLRVQNKSINVERQRRREDHYREVIADQVKKKDERMEMLGAEKRRFHEIRRQAQSEAHKAREQIKRQIHSQRVTSKYDAQGVADTLELLMQNEFLHPNIVNSAVV